MRPATRSTTEAADNGTGCGILLELARAFADAAKAGAAPAARRLLRRGDRGGAGTAGSEYLGMHPPVPAKDITLDLNYDMLLPIGIAYFGPRSRALSGPVSILR